MGIRKPLEVNEILKITNFEITEFVCNYIKIIMKTTTGLTVVQPSDL